MKIWGELQCPGASCLFPHQSEQYVPTASSFLPNTRNSNSWDTLTSLLTPLMDSKTFTLDVNYTTTSVLNVSVKGFNSQLWWTPENETAECPFLWQSQSCKIQLQLSIPDSWFYVIFASVCGEHWKFRPWHHPENTASSNDRAAFCYQCVEEEKKRNLYL